MKRRSEITQEVGISSSFCVDVMHYNIYVSSLSLVAIIYCNSTYVYIKCIYNIFECMNSEFYMQLYKDVYMYN